MGVDLFIRVNVLFFSLPPFFFLLLLVIVFVFRFFSLSSPPLFSSFSKKIIIIKIKNNAFLLLSFLSFSFTLLLPLSLFFSLGIRSLLHTISLAADR